MGEKILIITEKESDLKLFEEILGPKGFNVEGFSLSRKIEDVILNNGYVAIIADYDQTENRVITWIELLQKNRSRSCFILYGETTNGDMISEILQKGAYGFVPRAFLSERIYDTILGGLENRRAFIDILAMIDELRDVNERLKKEKEAFKIKNQELAFINRLSTEVAYDLNWDRILPRVLDAGLLKVIDIELISLLYRIGSRWNLALYLPEKEINKETIERLKEDIAVRFNTMSEEKISTKELILYWHPSNAKLHSPFPIPLSESTLAESLRIAGKSLGMFLVTPKNRKELKRGSVELVSTISNILAMSLKNAQEYHRLKAMAVTDGLTGIYNYKGFIDFVQREFQRARRYNNPLSLIMIDVDNFKFINDSLGHQAGDYILRELAYCLKSSARNTDIVARYGGDEFAVLCPETELGKAKVLVKRIINTIKNHGLVWGPERIKVEISYGISTTSELEKNGNEDALIHISDSRLYIAKRSRNPLNRASM